MYYSDKPIEEQKSDRLNRVEFSKQLAEAILSYSEIDNFAISLCGKWGSGKTSVLNMVIQSIEEQTKGKKRNLRPIIIKFNPWNYSDCTQLVSQFFTVMQNRLNMAGSNKALKAIGIALDEYASLLDYSVKFFPVIEPHLDAVKLVSSGIGKGFKDIAERNNDIEVKKENVIKKLEKQKRKFIIIIDDIDRLNNAQIRAIFQLVNSLAGFPNMIYLLAFDREIVTRALEEEQKCSGEEYLEKIIQVPFNIPEADKGLIDKIFNERWKNLKNNSDDGYWNTIYDTCISPYIGSIRDINRVMNSFEFKYNIMNNEVNSVDLMAITVLQIYAPEIYGWIFNNSKYLTGSGGTEDNREYYMNIFKEIYPKDPEQMLTIIQNLFPNIFRRTGSNSGNYDLNAELRRKDRIASEERINRYFNLSLEEIIIRKEQLKASMEKYNENSLSMYLDQLLDHNRLSDYIREVILYIDRISDDRIILFLNGLVKALEKVYRKSEEEEPKEICSLLLHIFHKMS